MRTLIVEDDFASRKFMTVMLSKYGECDSTDGGMEAIEIFKLGHSTGKPYDLVCLDIMMPDLDGYATLAKLREYEKELNITPDNGVKVIMTSALTDGRSVTRAFDYGCVAYAGKPIDKDKFEKELKKLGLI